MQEAESDAHGALYASGSASPEAPNRGVWNIPPLREEEDDDPVTFVAFTHRLDTLFTSMLLFTYTGQPMLDPPQYPIEEPEFSESAYAGPGECAPRM